MPDDYCSGVDKHYTIRRRQPSKSLKKTIICVHQIIQICWAQIHFEHAHGTTIDGILTMLHESLIDVYGHKSTLVQVGIIYNDALFCRRHK